MLAVFTVLLISCGSKHIETHMPEPVYGKDIIELQENQVAPFKGTLFGVNYLDDYLQWKDQNKCLVNT